jgi:hypothetical protein
MASYMVRMYRPVVQAATPEEAAQKSLREPLTDADEFYVLENDPSGSVHYVVGSASVLGGAFPMPQYIFRGPDFTPVTPPATQLNI